MSPNEDPFNNPFRDALKEFKPVKKSREEQPSIQSKAKEEKIEKEELPPAIEIIHAKTAAEIEQEAEDRKLWQEIVSLFGIDSSRITQKRYWGILRIVRDSRQHDTSYNIRRYIADWIQYETNPAKIARLKEISDFLLKRAYESSAVKSLIAATPEGMKYGRSSREERIREAIESATKAGLTIEEILQKHNIKLNINP